MKRRSRGFTMIELVVGLTIAALVVGFVASFIAIPVQAHLAQARRAELSASAETLTRSMAEDVRNAMPGSPRPYVVGGRVVLEMIPVLGVVRYCDETGAACPDKLDFAITDTQFDVAEDSRDVAAGFVAVLDNDPTNAASAQDAYLLQNMIAPAADTTGHLVTLQLPGFRFLDRSPNNRAFFVSGVTRYECDPVARTLRRFNRALPAAAGPIGAGAPSDLIASDVTACRFTYIAPPPPPRLPQNGGLVVVEITISRVTNGVTDNLRVVKQLRLEHTA
ncbi:MAG TPA: type II secretion system protein [Steroidobacteraceae bacterium]|nr:type II secretion system protein [Steroidobacteraceae bacterium]